MKNSLLIFLMNQAISSKKTFTLQNVIFFYILQQRSNINILNRNLTKTSDLGICLCIDFDFQTHQMVQHTILLPMEHILICKIMYNMPEAKPQVKLSHSQSSFFLNSQVWSQGGKRSFYSYLSKTLFTKNVLNVAGFLYCPQTRVSSVELSVVFSVEKMSVEKI